MSFNGNELNMSQIRELEGPQTDDLNQKKMHKELCAFVMKIKWWRVYYSLRKSEERLESEIRERMRKYEFENMMAQYFNIDQEDDMSGYDDEYELIGKCDTNHWLVSKMNWELKHYGEMDYYKEDPRYWMDDKTNALRCKRLNKKRITLRVSKTCVSRCLSLLAKRKETQKNTTLIRDSGRREKNAVN